MKKIACIVFASLLLFSSANAQAKKWKEMEDFHHIMSETFHPAEEGKFGPIKSRAQEMHDKAVAWHKSTPPEGIDKSKVKASLKQLSKGTKQLNKMVKANATDEELKQKLASLHDTFHEIMEKCEK